MLNKITNLEADSIIWDSDYEFCVLQDRCWIYNKCILVRLTEVGGKIINVLVYKFKDGPKMDLNEFIVDLLELPYDVYEFRSDNGHKYDYFSRKYGRKEGETYVIERFNCCIQAVKRQREEKEETA